MDAAKEESSNGSANTSRLKLRYSVRSANKPKDDRAASSAPKRGKPASSISKSVSVLNVSGKDKSAKPTKRLSVPAKSSISPLPRSAGIIAPIFDPRTKKAANKGQGKDLKSVSDVSKSTSRKKFSVLSSVSYWLSQIKISESAAKHSVSLGFFKLALESGCEPLQRMRDELKSYVRRHNLVELGEPLKELLTRYDISDNMEQLQTSDTCSQFPGQSSKTSEEGAHNSYSITRDKRLKPKLLISENVQTSSVSQSAKRGSPQTLTLTVTASKNRGSINKNSTKPNIIVSGNPQKRSQRPTKQVAKKETIKTQNQEENCVKEKDPVELLPAKETEQDDKENEDTQQEEEISLTELAI